MIRQAGRAIVILWAFTRRRLFWTLYLDVVRGHLSNPHCSCRDDVAMQRHARQLRQALEELGATFVKLGQFLSQRPDLMPALYVEELTRLQEHTPAVPFEEIRRHLEEVCICGRRQRGHEPRPACLHCRGIQGVFEAFDEQPLASASLAQVHRAVFRGRKVALKILKPGVLDRLNLDIDLLRRFRWIVGRGLGLQHTVRPAELVEEFRRRLLEEVRFENEALNIASFRESHPDDGPVAAPRVFWELDRADLLVMELVEGTSMGSWDGLPEERQRLAKVVAEDFLHQVFLANCFHADPHPGNLIVEPSGRVVYLDFGAVGRLDTGTRQGLLRLLRAILRDDADLATETVLTMGDTDPGTVDVPELQAEVARIIQLYRIRGGARWADAVVDAARRHRIRLPGGLLLYAKATMQTEALVNQLDPDFQVLPALERMALPLAEKELADFSSRWVRELPGAAGDAVRLLQDLLEALRSLSRRSDG